VSTATLVESDVEVEVFSAPLPQEAKIADAKSTNAIFLIIVVFFVLFLIIKVIEYYISFFYSFVLKSSKIFFIYTTIQIYKRFMKHLKKYESFELAQEEIDPKPSYYYSCDECDNIWKDDEECKSCKHCDSDEIEELHEEEWNELNKSK